MNKIIPVFSAVRIVPRDGDFLNRTVGRFGEIFYDSDTHTLRLYDGNVAGGIPLAKGDLSNIDNLAFKNKADAAGVARAGAISALPPESPVSGETWVDENTGIFYVYYNDGTSAQWIQPATSLYGTGGGGGTVSSGIIDIIAGNNITLTNNSGVVTINAVVDGGSSTLDSLSDVAITSPSIGQVLKYNGTIWINDTDATAQPGSASNSFTTIAVLGQSNVVADSATDTLTLVAGSNITITTNASTDTVTIAATGGGGGTASDSFTTIAVSGQSDVVADSATDTLTLVAGIGISITTNAATDTITFTNTAGGGEGGGATAFTELIDSADLTVNQFYLPAITRLNVTNNGASSYRFDQYGAADNPNLYALNGATIAFNLNVAGHPFLIQTSGGSNYNEGLTHVTTAGVVTTGASAQGKTSGTLYWKIPISITGNYRYICSIHGSMVGVITITPALLGNTVEQTFTEAVTFNGGYNEKVTTIGSISTSTYNLDISGSNIFDITLGTNVTVTFTNAPPVGTSRIITLIVRQPATSPGKTLTVTGAKYTDGALPILSTGANQIDVLTYWSVNGGTTYFGTFAMANVS
jgi:hypothetical protein